MATRYSAVEADFIRFYRLDVAGVYTGDLSVRQAARLLYELPPDAAIFRGPDLDSRVLSQESLWMRVLVNLWAEEPVKFPSEMAEQMRRMDKQKRQAEAHAARLKRDGGVTRER